MSVGEVGSGDMFVFVVPPALGSEAPAGNPWRPRLVTVDLSGVGTAAAWGSITGTMGAQADLAAALALLAPLASPALTGTPTAPTAAPGTSTTQAATTAFVAALGALKADLASPTLTGIPTAPTAVGGTNTTQLATTAFVAAAILNYAKIYNSGGLVSSPKAWLGSTTCDANGDWTISTASAGFASVLYAVGMPVSAAAADIDRCFPSVGTVNTTTVAGRAMRGATVVLASPSVRPAPNGTTILGLAIGA